MKKTSLCLSLLGLASVPGIAGNLDPGQLEFFEKKIRPVLTEHCFKCHSADAKKLKGELLLDSKPGWIAGGESGAVIVPGDPSASLLISALHYDKFEMPPKAKLPAHVIADFEKWIEMGAPDPRAEPTVRSQKGEEPFDLEKRKGWWSLQPVAHVAAPGVRNTTWPRSDTDRFVLAALEKKAWAPAAPAEKTSWLRRATYDLTGLPPNPDEAQAFLADDSPGAHAKVVDRLLASEHFGEQWARHWMDLVRYAETKAFEADYPMPNVYHYRDYLIRAFNSDVPYDQLLREAIAGDLIEPRLDPESGINESVIGPGYLYLTDGQHGPPDIHADEARIFDDMIDVVGKAFQSQTVACARCHDHKFDAITTKDYYSLYGIIASSRIDYADINSPSEQQRARQQLRAQKERVRFALADLLATDLKSAAGDLRAAIDGKAATAQQKRWAAALEKKPNAVMQTLAKLAAGDASVWGVEEPQGQALGRMSREGFGGWLTSGIDFEDKPRPPGDFIIAPDGDKAVTTFAGARPAAGHLASRFAGSIKSPTFTLAGDSVSVRVKGKNVRVSLYVRHYELIGRGPTTGGTTKVLNTDGWVEHRFNTKLWTGETAYIEVQQNGGQMNFKWAIDGHADGAYAVLDSATNNTPLPPLPGGAAAWKLGGEAPADATAMLEHVAARLAELAMGWRQGSLTVAQSDLLEGLFDAGVLEFKVGRSDALRSAIETYRLSQQAIPAPTYVRSMSDGHGIDEPVYIRGSHENLSKDANPRHFLDGVDSRPFTAPGSGRLQWAEALADEGNPLTARVMVNRIWHHLFGSGLVSTVDDFGHMGEKPSHPELLDHLASTFVEDGWSIKTTIRKLVLSSTYRMSAAPSEASKTDDPGNIYLQHMPVRRLQAEGVRDTVLAVSGQLDRKLFGPSMGGDGGNRRSVYIQLKRRYMPEFLMTFDMPNATETFGRRNITASPMQSLAMMNSGFVWKAAEKWASRAVANQATFAEKIDLLHREAFGRGASERELDWARGFLADLKLDEASAAKHGGLFREICHTMLNRKELIYVY